MKLKINININNKLIILTTSLVIIAISIFIFVLYPNYTKIKTQNNEINDQRIQLAIFQEQRKNIDQTRTDLKKIEENIDDISLIFVNQDDILDLVDSLDIIAKKNNLEQTISLGNIENLEIDKYLEIHVSLDGQWNDFIAYLNSLEKLDTYIILDNLNFTKENESVNLTFSAFIYTS